LAAIPVGVGEGKEVGVGELVSACVLVGIANGLTIVGVGTLVAVGSAAATATVSVAAGETVDWGASAGPMGLQPASMTAVNRNKAISLGGLSFLRSAGFSGTITLT